MQTESQIKKPDSRLKTAGMTEGIPAGMTKGELFIPFAFSGAERRVFARKEKLTPSEWAEQRRIVTMGAHRGPWRNSISPHLAHIMDTWALPHVREVIICKSPQTGGPLALDTLVPTTNGWKIMQDIKIGDSLFDENGNTCVVEYVSPIYYNRRCYQITFDDSSKIVCDGSHRWSVIAKNRKYNTVIIPTEKIYKNFIIGKGRQRYNYSIPITKSLTLSDKKLPISPYTLGVWLGDGAEATGQITIHTNDAHEIAQYLNESGHYTIVRKPKWIKGNCLNLLIEPRGHRKGYCIRGHNTNETGTFKSKDGTINCSECHRQLSMKYQYGKKVDEIIRNTFITKLTHAKLTKNKHIPMEYLRASYNQRLELLQGIMDTDGYISEKGTCEITILEEKLKDDIYELLSTFGIKAKIKSRICSKPVMGRPIKNPKLHYRISFTPYAIPVFKLKRKLCKVKKTENLKTTSNSAKATKRKIIEVIPVQSVPVKCIKVSSPSSLFLIGKSFIATHNTESQYNCAAYAMERDPSVMLFVAPRETDARKTSSDRIIPMLNDSPRLRELLSPNPDDTASRRIKLNHGAIVYTAWSNSSSALASFPVKYIFFDEVDKYPPFIGKETDPITLGEKRARTFRYTHKIFKVSTPTREDGTIWKAYNKADVIYKYHVPCPKCGATQIMKFGQLKWPEAAAQEEIKREGAARYACEHCPAEWTDTDRDIAIHNGEWQTEKGRHIKRPRSVAYHLPSFISPDVSLSEIVSVYLQSKNDKAKLIDFYNDYLAEPFIEKISERKEDEILALRDIRPRGLVPKDICCLTAAVDTQARGFYYEVRAWGHGYDLESWQIREGFVENFTGLVKIIFDDMYKNADGAEHKISIALIDSGGGMGDFGVSRTAEVYDFCRRFPGIIPIKGQQRMSQPHKITQLDVYPGTNKYIPGGLSLYNLNVTYYKDYLASKLTIAPADPGAWHLHNSATSEYARQLTAEYKDERGLWQCPRNRANHFWDVSVYNLAAADILGVKYIKNPNIQEVKKNENISKEVEPKSKRSRW